MNRIYVSILAVILCAACSAPKYTYHFDHYDYNSGRPKKTEATAVAPSANQETLVLDETTTASSSEAIVVVNGKNDINTKKATKPVKSYKEMNKAERKEFRKEVKKEFKQYVNTVKKGEKIEAQGPQGTLDRDLKLAIIFGAVGLVLALFGGISEVFTVLGVIAILVGVYFLIKWLIRQ